MGILSNLFGDKSSADVLELLSAQHDEVDALFAHLQAREGNRRELITEVANQLAAHMTVEEEIFYPAIMAKSTTDMIHESAEEHLSIRRLLADLLTMQLDEASFQAKLSVLEEQVSHHAHKEEEKKLFPEVRELMSLEERVALGNECLAKFVELLAQNPAARVPSETDAAAPLPAVQ